MLRLQKLKFDLKSELEVLIPYSVLLLNFPQRLLTVATQLQEGLSSRLNCGGKTFKNSAFQPQQTGSVVIFYLSLETMPNDVHHRSLWICPLKWPQPSWVLFLPFQVLAPKSQLKVLYPELVSSDQDLGLSSKSWYHTVSFSSIFLLAVSL